MTKKGSVFVGLRPRNTQAGKLSYRIAKLSKVSQIHFSLKVLEQIIPNFIEIYMTQGNETFMQTKHLCILTTFEVRVRLARHETG